MSSQTKTQTKKRSKRNARAARRAKPAHRTHHSPEHRERLHRARRALRTLHMHVFFPKAVLHTNKMRAPSERMLEEVPELALIEHWEAIGELKSKGIDVRHTNARSTLPHLLRTVELDAPISAHARQFASNHGLLVHERRSPIRSSLERIFG